MSLDLIGEWRRKNGVCVLCSRALTPRIPTVQSWIGRGVMLVIVQMTPYLQRGAAGSKGTLLWGVGWVVVVC